MLKVLQQPQQEARAQPFRARRTYPEPQPEDQAVPILNCRASATLTAAAVPADSVPEEAAAETVLTNSGAEAAASASSNTMWRTTADENIPD